VLRRHHCLEKPFQIQIVHALVNQRTRTAWRIQKVAEEEADTALESKEQFARAPARGPEGNAWRPLRAHHVLRRRRFIAFALMLRSWKAGCRLQAIVGCRFQAIALKLLASVSPRPSLIILDLEMPNLDGWRFRAEQARAPNLASISTIVVTAAPDASVSAAAVLRKPLRLAQRANTIASLLEQETGARAAATVENGAGRPAVERKP
jgi:CheY-like chemotaxis protein